jgi:hypothetical protein
MGLVDDKQGAFIVSRRVLAGQRPQGLMALSAEMAKEESVNFAIQKVEL